MDMHLLEHLDDNLDPDENVGFISLMELNIKVQANAWKKVNEIYCFKMVIRINNSSGRPCVHKQGTVHSETNKAHWSTLHSKSANEVSFLQHTARQIRGSWTVEVLSYIQKLSSKFRTWNREPTGKVGFMNCECVCVRAAQRTVGKRFQAGMLDNWIYLKLPEKWRYKCQLPSISKLKANLS